MKQAVVTVTVLLFMSSQAFSAIPRMYDAGSAEGSPKPMIFSTLPQDFSKGLNATSIQPMESLQETRSEDIAKLIPTDLQPSSSASHVANQILDHSLTSYWNSAAVKNSELGHSAHSVENHMQTGASFGGDQPNSIKHSFQFQVKATDTKALVTYSGYTNAELSYQAAQSQLNLEVHEQVAMVGTQVVYDHTVKPGENRDVVSMKWVW